MPAFPCAQSQQTYLNQDGAPYQTGMTLRDYFAGQALISLAKYAENHEWREESARQAYAWADAMIKAMEA